ncbi:MAG: heme exporter protein CcmB [Deltaproteobacteria bacterium]|jgi:heme exporter protein B|nr:heme exporter protein CcmB [Deltaproteobacteria bacterium]
MIRAALLMARKDLLLLCARGAGLAQALLLGLLLLFIFSLARGIAEEFSAQAASAVFWMATLFCQVLIFNALYALEEDNGQRQALLMLPVPEQSIWAGKGLAGMVILLAAQGVFIPATVVFLDQDIQGGLLGGLRLILTADLGLAAAGSLLGALAQGRAARESLLSVIIFPLLLPLLLAAIRLGAEAISGAGLEEAENWFRLLLVFDGLFLAAGLALFGFIYNAQE